MSKTPALFSKQCSGRPVARNASANARTDARESRSRCITSQSSGGAPGSESRVHCSTSAWPRFTVRHARMTRAPSRANVSAVVVPMPLVGPVTMKVLPSTSGPHTSLGSEGRCRVCHLCSITSSMTFSHVRRPIFPRRGVERACARGSDWSEVDDGRATWRRVPIFAADLEFGHRFQSNPGSRVVFPVAYDIFSDYLLVLLRSV